MGDETFYWDGLNDIVLASSPNIISKGYNSKPFFDNKCVIPSSSSI